MARKRKSDTQKAILNHLQTVKRNPQSELALRKLQASMEANVPSINKLNALIEEEKKEQPNYERMRDLVGTGLEANEVLMLLALLRIEAAKRAPKSSIEKTANKHSEIYGDYLTLWYKKPYQSAKKICIKLSEKYRMTDDSISRIFTRQRQKRDLPRLSKDRSDEFN